MSDVVFWHFCKKNGVSWHFLNTSMLVQQLWKLSDRVSGFGGSALLPLSHFPARRDKHSAACRSPLQTAWLRQPSFLRLGVLLILLALTFSFFPGFLRLLMFYIP